MEFKVLTEDERDEIMVAFLKSQERDHFCYGINADRYEKILADNTITDEAFKERIAKLVVTERAAQKQVEKILEHSKHQLPSDERIKAAHERMKARGAI